jgi:hypothetical protein
MATRELVDQPHGAMARVLPPIKVAGVTYRVLRLDGDYGPRYLLRSEAGELLGLYPYGAEPMRLYAAPLEPTRGAANPFARLQFFGLDGRLMVDDAPPRAR